MHVNVSGNRDIDHRYLLSVENGDLEGTELCLKNGANPLVQSKDSKIVSSIGTVLNSYFYLKSSLQGKKYFWKTANSVTALHIAARKGHKKIVEMLIRDHSQLIPMTDSKGANALFWAHKECIGILLEANIDIYIKDIHGRTALFTMIYHTNITGIQLIVEQMTKQSPIKTDHSFIYRVLQPTIPSVLIKIITQYYSLLDKTEDDLYIPEFFLKYTPGCKEFIAYDSHWLDKSRRGGVAKVNALFLEYGIVLSECRVMKDPEDIS